MSVKPFIPSIIIILTFFLTYAFCNGDKLMDKFIREKNNFSNALEGLKKGQTIHRAGSFVKYLRREIIIDGKSSFEYGYQIDDRDFHPGTHISIEDMLQDDWIIEEKK
jgi:hypothetical protein